MSNTDHTHFSTSSNNMLEAIILDFAPTLLDQPEAMATIHAFVFDPFSPFTNGLDLASSLQLASIEWINPELLPAFLHCLNGLRTFVDMHQLQNMLELEQAMNHQQAQMAQRLFFLHSSL